MDAPFKCPHCGGSKFSVRGGSPETVVCVGCGHRVEPVSRQAQAPKQASPTEANKQRD
jgi:transcription elongation factor Elf1